MTTERVHWRLLGGPEILVDGHPVTVRFDRSRAVMSYLVLRADERVSTERLIDEIWQSDPPKSARNSVQRFVADLRKDLGVAASRIESVPDGYRLRMDPDDQVDVDEVKRAIHIARRHLEAGQPHAALGVLPPHLDMTHEPFAGLDQTAFSAIESVRLRDLVLEAVELRIRSRLGIGDNDAAALDAQIVLEKHPYRERTAADLMLALYRSGRAAEALGVSRELHRALVDELGCAPMPTVVDLERRILDHDLELLLPDCPPVEGAHDDVDGVFGRGDILAELDRLLHRERLVTLVGPGGIGKTTVASVAAARWADQTGGSVREVELNSTTAAGFQSAIGEVVGISSRPDEDRSLEVLDRLKTSPTLLVLDNCEHLVDAVRDFVAAVHQHAPQVKVLCTSRRSIGHRAEVLRRVDVLDDDSALQLLTTHAARLGVPIGVENPLVRRLLARLDGVPLAIVLAASALRTLGIADLLERTELVSAVPDRSTETTPDRHRTIDAALEWSMSLVDPGDLEILVTCATFASDFDLDGLAAATLLPPDRLLAGVSSLVDHSLLQSSRKHGRARYRLLVPIRESLRARRETDNGEVERRLVAHSVDIAERCLAEISGASPSTGIDRLATEIANFRLAFELADDTDDVASMARLATAIGWATGMAPQTLAHGALQDWARRLEKRLAGTSRTDSQLWTSLVWAQSGCGHWEWLRRLPDNDEWSDVSAVAVAVAILNGGDRLRAWKWFQWADIDPIDNPAIKTWAAAIGAGLALHVRDAAEYRRLCDLAIDSAAHRHSVIADYWAEFTRTSMAVAMADPERFEIISDRQLAGVSGHGLVSLEYHSKQLLAGASFALGRRDPIPVLIDLIGEAIEQNSVNPETEALAFDTAILVLHQHGRNEDAARLAGLLKRLGIFLALFHDELTAFHEIVDADRALTAARMEGQASSTVDVLRRTHGALVDLDTAS